MSGTDETTAADVEPEALTPEVILDDVRGDTEDDESEGDGELMADASRASGDERAEPFTIDLLPRPAPSKNLPSRTGSTSLAARDPLRAYMNEVAAYELLTPEEEKDLAVAFRDEGDQAAAYRLVTSNLRLVAKIAFKYRRFYKNVLDLIQEGNIGLMKAVQKFDPYRGVRLSTYARYWIQAYIMYFLLANHRMVKVGTTQAKRKLFYNLTKETKRLRDLGFDPTPQRIADSLDVDVKDVIEMKQRLASPDASLDAPIGGDEGRPFGDTFAAKGDAPDDEVADAEMMSMVTGAMRAFGETITNEREVVIWFDRLMSEDPLTLQDIGDRFGVTRERARQIEAKLKTRLKAYLLSTLGPEVELSVEFAQ